MEFVVGILAIVSFVAWLYERKEQSDQIDEEYRKLCDGE